MEDAPFASLFRQLRELPPPERLAWLEERRWDRKLSTEGYHRLVVFYHSLSLPDFARIVRELTDLGRVLDPLFAFLGISRTEGKETEFHRLCQEWTEEVLAEIAMPGASPEERLFRERRIKKFVAESMSYLGLYEVGRRLRGGRMLQVWVMYVLGAAALPELGGGNTANGVAQVLGISPDTVSSHCRRVAEALDLPPEEERNSVAAILRHAARQGWLRCPHTPPVSSRGTGRDGSRYTASQGCLL